MEALLVWPQVRWRKVLSKRSSSPPHCLTGSHYGPQHSLARTMQDCQEGCPILGLD